MPDQPKLTVLGAGSWGTALAALTARNGVATRLWGRDAAALAQVAAQRCNARYLPGVLLPAQLHYEADLGAAVRGADIVLIVVPSHAFAAMLNALGAGDEGPHLRDDGGGTGWFSSGGPRVRFLTRYDGEVSEPLVGRQGSRVSMRVARGSVSLLSSPGRGTWPRDVLKKVSRGLSRVEAGNPGFPRLVQVTSGGFSWWL